MARPRTKDFALFDRSPWPGQRQEVRPPAATRDVLDLRPGPRTGRMTAVASGQTGEDKTAFDCVSFVSKETCAAENALWSDDSQLGPGGCAHSASAVKTIDSASASGPALLVTVLAAAAAAL